MVTTSTIRNVDPLELPTSPGPVPDLSIEATRSKVREIEMMLERERREREQRTIGSSRLENTNNNAHLLIDNDRNKVPSFSVSRNILVMDSLGARVEQIQDLLARYEKCGGNLGGIAARERGIDAYREVALNAVCSPASLSIVGCDSNSSPVEGCSVVAGQVMDYLTAKYRQDPTFKHDSGERLANWILRLCTEFTQIVTSEPVFLQLRSPLYVLGDIHGNFSDLHFFMSQLIPFGHMKYCTNQFLFLGDYVDRGSFGVEVIAYLFAIKVLSPSSVYLLRGNHELFTINGDQQHYCEGSFKTQCLRRFGPKLGDDVWVAVNEAFKVLPLAAVVDGKVFCTHGGIPRYSGGEDLRIRMLSDPNFPRFNSTHPQAGDSQQRRIYREIAMDLLWSDPSDDEEGLDEFGFGPNARGVNTYTFGNKAIDTFLRNHGYEFVVRAHELKQDGLRIAKCAKVLTVFTSSGYCGGENGSGALFIGNGKIRMISVSFPGKDGNAGIAFGQQLQTSNFHMGSYEIEAQNAVNVPPLAGPSTRIRENSVGPTSARVRADRPSSPVLQHRTMNNNTTDDGLYGTGPNRRPSPGRSSSTTPVSNYGTNRPPSRPMYNSPSKTTTKAGWH